MPIGEVEPEGGDAAGDSDHSESPDSAKLYVCLVLIVECMCAPKLIANGYLGRIVGRGLMCPSIISHRPGICTGCSSVSGCMPKAHAWTTGTHTPSLQPLPPRPYRHWVCNASFNCYSRYSGASAFYFNQLGFLSAWRYN